MTQLITLSLTDFEVFLAFRKYPDNKSKLVESLLRSYFENQGELMAVGASKDLQNKLEELNKQKAAIEAELEIAKKKEEKSYIYPVGYYEQLGTKPKK